MCPPGAAADVLESVLAAAPGSTPVYADLNAVSPALVESLADRAAEPWLPFVDGSISGGPPAPGGDTLVYLSGAQATVLAALPSDGIRRRVVGERPGTASAVKMCTASVYKGTTLVWLQALATAYRLGVLDHVLADLGEEFPDEVAGAARRLAMAASKSGRFVGEMEQIAATQGARGCRRGAVRGDGRGLRSRVRYAAGRGSPPRTPGRSTTCARCCAASARPPPLGGCQPKLAR